MALLPFDIGGSSTCQECGATGDYELLANRVRAIHRAWVDAGRYPDTSTDRAAIEAAIDAAVAAIDMEIAT